jgi:predicted SAM-dependent methyltransferase
VENELEKKGAMLLLSALLDEKGVGGWTTVDLGGADIFHDLRNGIPLPGSSVDRIYTSHLFEHIPFKDLVLFINECYRVLKLGGELSVCVPNAGNYINAYIEKRHFRERGKGYAPAIVDTGSYIDQVNYIAYMDGQHHYLFDEENLINTIKTSPFKFVALRKFDPDIDLESRDYESIYASAIK